MAAAALRGVRGCSPWVVALSKGGGPQASIRRCASGGGGGVRWDGGISSTTKHKRFQRQGHRAIVPEAFVHRPVVQTVETSDGQVVINGNPVSRLYTQKARARGFATDNMVKHFQHRCGPDSRSTPLSFPSPLLSLPRLDLHTTSQSSQCFTLPMLCCAVRLPWPVLQAGVRRPRRSSHRHSSVTHTPRSTLHTCTHSRLVRPCSALLRGVVMARKDTDHTRCLSV
jgi:hypothetical protein